MRRARLYLEKLREEGLVEVLDLGDIRGYRVRRSEKTVLLSKILEE